MENRVYYGQYSLKHWLELILRKNILLPGYQRYFVWDEDQVKTLIKTFKEKLFVPPITIGAFKEDGQENKNLILDGQQRLTSILLAYLGLYPDKAKFKATLEEIAAEKLANDNDDEEDTDNLDNILRWNFSRLTDRGKKKGEILDNLPDGNYKELDFEVNDAFFKQNFLGFSYLVPHAVDSQTQQKYYSSVFRNINAQGQPLLAQESRASLYFLNESLSEFFNPELIQSISVKNLGSDNRADFVRFLSLLSQFAQDGNANKVARGFKPKMETYYEDYIYSVVGERVSQRFKDFNSIFPNGDYKPRFQILEQSIAEIILNNQFNSIIDLDLYFFGLIFWVVFENKTIDFTRVEQLRQELNTAINALKADEGHKKAPAALKYLKQRLVTSIEIYKKYIHDQA